MIKRVISAVTLALLLCQSVSAASIKTAEYSNGKFTLSGITDEVNKPVKIEVLNNAVSHEDTKNITSENVRDVYLYIDQSYSDSEGNFSFSVPTDGKIGNFNVKVSFLSGEELKTEFYTYTASQVENEVNSFLNNSGRTTAELDTLINTYYLALGVNISDVKLLKSENYNALLIAVTNNEEVKDLTQAVNEELILKLVSQGTDFETLERYSEYTDLKSSNYYDDWKNLSVADKTDVAEALKGVSTLGEMNRKTENEIIIKTLKASVWSDLENKLTHYKDNISLDLSAVSALSEANQKNVYLDLNSALSNDEITDISQVNAKINAFAQKYKNSSSSSGSKGSGGGSRGGSSSFSAPVVNVQDKSEDSLSPFDDIKTVDWASTAIIKLYEKGIITGKGDKIFDPNGSVTREEFTAMIVRSFGISSNGTPSGFDDVPENRWSSGAIASAKQNGIVSGMSDTYFGATEKISRRDIAVIAYNAAVKYGAEFNGENISVFSDADKIAEYAKEAISKLSAAKIVNGSDGSFKPDDFATRAEAAVIIHRIMQYCAIMD